MKQRILVVLSLIGIGISIYLTLKAHNPNAVACSLGGGCEKVLSSSYAWFHGLPVSGMGLFWYMAEIIFAWFTYYQKLLPNTYLKIWGIVGLLFSFYLFGLEATKIHYYCTWCLTSLVVVILLNVVTFGMKSRTNE